ncbi:MerR family transcriptional regulator [Zavarzinia sp.]|uniref:MerR family transcriptional regulator n=1 Tax=Zavarzinia sp. TaxID=2027920 RepID=UPI003564BD8B
MPARALDGEGDEPRAPRSSTKQPGAFRTISEVAEELDVPQHVLRFWETRFPQIKPMKRGGGRRYYRPEDVALLRGIRHLLYSDGYTIKGVQKVLRESGAHAVIATAKPVAERLADHRTPEPPPEPEATPAPAAVVAAQPAPAIDEPPAEEARDAAYWRGLVLDLRRELEEIRRLLRER